MALTQLDGHLLSRIYQRVNRFVVLMLGRWLSVSSQCSTEVDSFHTKELCLQYILTMINISISHLRRHRNHNKNHK